MEKLSIYFENVLVLCWGWGVVVYLWVYIYALCVHKLVCVCACAWRAHTHMDILVQVCVLCVCVCVEMIVQGRLLCSDEFHMSDIMVICVEHYVVEDHVVNNLMSRDSESTKQQVYDYKMF